MSDRQPAPANRAVFLSYASQDAEAVERIAAALRAAGVEVWFDKNELVGGDAWDAKIRGQIKSCALFVPVISAHTNARREGYFRREWKLAVDRTHDMDEALPFLVPVVIDGTTDAGAFVPEKFREVQWTRLPGGETPDKFCARVKALLHGEVAPPDVRKSGLVVESMNQARGRDGRATPAKKFPRWALAVGAVLLLGVGAFLALRPRRGPEEHAQLVASPHLAAAHAPANPAAPTTPVEQVLAQALSIADRLTYTRDELAAAEDMAKHATELAPDSARAWGVWALTEATQILRNWDRSSKRLRDTESVARRALALDPNQVEALWALGQVLTAQKAATEAESMARQALRVRPDDNRAVRLLSDALGSQGRTEEQRVVLIEHLKRNPRDTILHYDLAKTYAGSADERGPSASDVTTALEQLDAALAGKRFASALQLKALYQIGWQGDLAAMRATLAELEKLPIFERAEDQPLFAAMWGALLEGQPERTLAVAALTSRPYLVHSLIASPRAWQAAMARTVAGQISLANLEWQAAEAALRERLRENPGAQLEAAQLAATLARLGRTEEAARLATPLAPMARETRDASLNLALVHYYAALGDAAGAAPYFRIALNRLPILTDHTLPLDPWWAKLRGQPEFEALLAEGKARIAAAKAVDKSPVAPASPPDKSVAVLAFADNSPNHDSEYYSDGISEELISALGKVPGLKVPAVTSSFYFKGKRVPMQEIAQQLGVAYVIEGSVMRIGDQVRISARLCRATDGFQEMSETFTRDAKNVFAVEEEIAGLIAKKLSLKLGVSSAVAAVNPRATELYLQAMQTRLMSDQAAAATLSEDLFQQALKLEPRFVRAHAALTGTWLLRAYSKGEIGRFDQRDGAALARLTARAREGVALDPASSDAHAALGLALALGWKVDEALDEMRRALAINPNDVNAHTGIGAGMRAMGDMDQALEEGRRAYELDPLAIGNLTTYGHALSEAGQYAAACAIYDRSLALQPTNKMTLTDKATALARLGRIDEAVTLVPGAQDRTDSPQDISDSLVAAQVMILRLAGRLSEAEALRPRLSSLDPTTSLALGRTEEALATLEPNAVTAMNAHFWVWDPLVDPIRNDPRFAKFLATLGLTEAHARAQAWRAAHPPEKPAAKP